jgi:hypothetical protein
MKPPSPSLRERSRSDACLEIARVSFLSLFESGSRVNLLSTATLLLTVLTAVGMVAMEGWRRDLWPSQYQDWAIMGCLSISVLFGLLQQYSALRVAIDVRIFRHLQHQVEVWSARSEQQLERGERLVPEAILASAIQSIKSTAPSILAGQTHSNSAEHDPLDPYRRTARVYYRQILFAIFQIVLFWIGVTVLVLWH